MSKKTVVSKALQILQKELHENNIAIENVFTSKQFSAEIENIYKSFHNFEFISYFIIQCFNFLEKNRLSGQYDGFDEKRAVNLEYVIDYREDDEDLEGRFFYLQLDLYLESSQYLLKNISEISVDEYIDHNLRMRKEEIFEGEIVL